MKVAGRLFLAGLVAASVWAAGLAWFIHAAGRPAAPPPHADGIVALTGGAGRVEAALRLLAERRAERLLVTGIGGGADLSDLARQAGIGAEQLEGRVTLGRQATTTLGNADEAAAWAKAHGMRSLIVVTAGYHMPRALAELSRAMPDVELHAAPVRPPALRDGVGDPATLRLMAEEYTKWLAVALGLHTGAPPEIEQPATGRPEAERVGPGRRPG